MRGERASFVAYQHFGINKLQLIFMFLIASQFSFRKPVQDQQKHDHGRSCSRRSQPCRTGRVRVQWSTRPRAQEAS
jgi:hypothetical protein